MLALGRVETDENQRPGDGGGPADGTAGGPIEPFTGLADLDEDLRTMSQNSTEVERWRRLSTRGLTPAAGIERDEAPLGLAPPIVSDTTTTAEMEALAAVTAPGTIAAPVEPPTPKGPPDPDTTAQLRAVSPELLAELEKRPSAPARKSFAPPKDTASAPPGSRVVLPREASDGVAEPRPSSRPPLRVPRPSQPPPDPEEASVRGWRASDPANEADDAVAGVVIPPPARLPSLQGPSSSPPSAIDGAPKASDTPPAQATPAGDAFEIDGRLLALGLGVAAVAFFGLYYLLFL